MTSDMATSILASMAKCSVRMWACNLNPRRIPASRMMAIAMPEKMAPATKYGAKIVECQPGVTDIAKSHETTLWTDTAKGMAMPAKIGYARS